MENLDIIILTSILATLFIVFGILMYRESRNITDQSNDIIDKSPRANMVRFIGGMFDEEYVKMTKKEKQKVYKAVTRTMSDMESGGVYFSEEAKELLEQKRKELNCEYSGLPSVASYMVEEVIK